jgi:hypothetical protein
VAEDTLVMANAVGPTSGTIASFIGGLTGLGVHLATGSGNGGAAATLLVAGCGYLISGTIGATMSRDLLGPPPLAADEQRASLSAELGRVASGLASGARHVWQRRPVAAALGATAGQRAMYGILLLASILLYRNYFYPTSEANSALAHFTLVVIAAAIGYGAAAVVTPLATKRLSKATWIAVLLATGGVVTGSLGPTFQQPSFLVIALALGVVAQGVAICATTILQQEMDDSFRGRVFALYDMLFNVPFVIGALVAAEFIPVSGKSYPLIVAAAIGYLAVAGGYALATRQAPPSGPEPAPAGGGSPSASAQRRNS